MEFPFDINTLLGGAVRVLIAEPTAGVLPAIPAGPKDIFAQSGAMAAAVNWRDFGATRDSFTYDRSLEATGWEIQNAQGPVVEQITNLTRRVTVSVAGLDEKAFRILEQAQNTGTIASVAGQSSYKTVGMGSVTTLERYRVAFASQRDIASGVVIEPGGAVKRGRLVVGVGWEASITADSASIEQAKGGLTAVPLTFNFYPVSSQASDVKYGKWYLEDAGTMT